MKSSPMPLHHKLVRAIHDLFSFPPLWEEGVVALLARNFLHLKRRPLEILLWAIFEPILYLVAIGLGVGWVTAKGDSQSYYAFFFPALMVIWSALVAFQSTTFESMGRLMDSGGIHVTKYSPISPSEVALSEIFWGSLKGFGASFTLAVLALAQGFLNLSTFGAALLICLITSWVFAALGCVILSIVRSLFEVQLFFGFVILPIVLLSGTLFPFQILIESVRLLLVASPLTHAVLAQRLLFADSMNGAFYLHLGVLFAFGTLLSNLAISRLSRGYRFIEE